MIRAMCGVKLIEKRSGRELMNLVGLDKILDRLTKANTMRWHGHVLRRDNDGVLRRALDFEVVQRRGRGRPKIGGEAGG